MPGAQYQEQAVLVQKAQVLFAREAKQLEATYEKRSSLREAFEALEKEIQAYDNTFDEKFEQLQHERSELCQALEAIEVQAVATETTIKNTHAILVEQLTLLASLKSRVKELQVEQAELEPKKFNVNFLSVIESGQYKLTLASLMRQYWCDLTPAVSAEIFSEMAARFNHISPELKRKQPALIQVLSNADEHIQALSEDLTVEQYSEHADFFFDISATVPNTAVKINAMIMAGLCWQMGARQSDDPAEQMALEGLSLKLYQLTLQLASKLPVSYALYITTHVPKYLSELQYKQSTMSMADLQTLTANMHNRNEFVSPTQFAFYTVHTGSPLQSIEGAIDRAFYLMSYFPIYSAQTHLLDQVYRQTCYAALQKQVLTRFEAKFKNASEQETMSVSDAELVSYLYKDALKSGNLPDTELGYLRLRCMELLFEQTTTSLKAMNQLLNAPYVSMPQDTDGFWKTGPLSYPDNPDSVNLVIYKSFDGYSLNKKTGEIRLSLTRWEQGDDPNDRLFTHQDLLDLIEGGVGTAIFSLDENSVYRQEADPFQRVRFSPHSLKDTEYLRSLFATDYIMKMISQGTEINARPPYNTRSIKALFEGLDKSVQEEILLGTENAEDSRATRFWLQAGAIPRAEEERGYTKIVRYGDPALEVKKQFLTLDTSGHLIDAPVDPEDTSKQARFAAGLTKHLNKDSETGKEGAVLEILPVFKQAKAFYAISGAIQELQKDRLINELNVTLHKEHLESSAHWVALRDQQRAEWKAIDWDKYLAEKIETYTKIVNNDAHWERSTEDTFQSLKSKRVALETGEGEEYREIHAALFKEHATRAQALYEGTGLGWSLTHPGFKSYCLEKFDEIKKISGGLAEGLQQLFSTVFNAKKEHATTEEAMLHKHKSETKHGLFQGLSAFKAPMGVTPYKAAASKFLQGDIAPMVQKQAEFEVSKMLAGDKHTPEITSFLEKIKQTILAENKAALLAWLSKDVPKILNQPITKAVYTEADPVFTAVYNQQRAENRQRTIDENKASVSNWNQYQAEYLKQIDALLDRDFSKRSQLVNFNQAAAQIREHQRNKWVMELLSESPAIMKPFDGKQALFEAAVTAALDGNPDRLAQAQTDMLFQSLSTAVKNNALKTPAAKQVWEKLLAREIEAQTKIMGDVLQTILSKPKEEQVCPDYAYLEPYFADEAYEEAFDKFAAGDTNVFVESQVAFSLEKQKDALSGDLQAKAKEAVDATREELRKDIPGRAKKETDNFKAVLENKMEEQLDIFIKGQKEALKEAIRDGNRLEASFLRMRLGKAEGQDLPSNTALRVPAVFSKQHDKFVYGGNVFRPLFRKVVEVVDKAIDKINGFLGVDALSLFDAKNMSNSLRNVSFSDGYDLFSAKKRLDNAISFAEKKIQKSNLFNSSGLSFIDKYSFGLYKSSWEDAGTNTHPVYAWRATEMPYFMPTPMHKSAPPPPFRTDATPPFRPAPEAELQPNFTPPPMPDFQPSAPVPEPRRVPPPPSPEPEVRPGSTNTQNSRVCPPAEMIVFPNLMEDTSFQNVIDGVKQPVDVRYLTANEIMEKRYIKKQDYPYVIVREDKSPALRIGTTKNGLMVHHHDLAGRDDVLAAGMLHVGTRFVINDDSGHYKMKDLNHHEVSGLDLETLVENTFIEAGFHEARNHFRYEYDPYGLQSRNQNASIIPAPPCYFKEGGSRETDRYEEIESERMSQSSAPFMPDFQAASKADSQEAHDLVVPNNRSSILERYREGYQVISKLYKKVEKYANGKPDSHLDGLGRGLTAAATDFSNLALHPYDNFLNPTSKLLYNLMVVGNRHHMMSAQDPKIAYLREQTLSDLVSDRAYHDSKKELEAIGDGLLTAMNYYRTQASPEECTKALTRILVPGYGTKAVSTVRANLKNFNRVSVPYFSPVVFWPKAKPKILSYKEVREYGMQGNQSPLMYAITQKGELVIGLKQMRPTIHHSHLAKGKPVAAAGDIYMNRAGEIIKIDTRSGSYIPWDPKLSSIVVKKFREALFTEVNASTFQMHVSNAANANKMLRYNSYLAPSSMGMFGGTVSAVGNDKATKEKDKTQRIFEASDLTTYIASRRASL